MTQNIRDTHQRLVRLEPGERRDIYILPQLNNSYRITGVRRNFRPTDRHVVVGTYTRDIALDDLIADVASIVAEIRRERPGVRPVGPPQRATDRGSDRPFR